MLAYFSLLSPILMPFRLFASVRPAFQPMLLLSVPTLMLLPCHAAIAFFAICRQP